MQEARTARMLIEALEILNDLLWDHYGEQVMQLYREEQQYESRRRNPRQGIAATTEEIF